MLTTSIELEITCQVDWAPDFQAGEYGVLSGKAARRSRQRELNSVSRSLFGN